MEGAKDELIRRMGRGHAQAAAWPAGRDLGIPGAASPLLGALRRSAEKARGESAGTAPDPGRKRFRRGRPDRPFLDGGRKAPCGRLERG